MTMYQVRVLFTNIFRRNYILISFNRTKNFSAIYTFYSYNNWRLHKVSKLGYLFWVLEKENKLGIRL